MAARRRGRASRASATHETSPPPRPASDLAPPMRTWRFYVRWAARLALLLVSVLASARVVTIPAPPLPPSRTSALLLFTHSRPAYLNRSLASILRHHPGGPHWPVIVSHDRQDGLEHADVLAVTRAAAARLAAPRGISLHIWAHEVSYDDAPDAHHAGPYVDGLAYRRIARHYRWALARAFAHGVDGARLERVVIVEDDMEVAPDFFEYFTALAPVLEADDSLLCVSAWNDNGIAGLAGDHERLHRTDFFPGLGWMLTRALWEELAPKWPAAFWDDWMRSAEQTRGRQCIRPEVSRVANFGAKGVSQSFYFEQHVSKVVLATRWVNFTAMDFEYLQVEVYRDYIFSRMSRAVQLRFSNYLTTRPQDEDVVAFYPENPDAIAKRTGIMRDHREGVRRTGYEGVVFFPWNGHWAFVVKKGWEPPEGYRLEGRMCC